MNSMLPSLAHSHSQMLSDTRPAHAWLRKITLAFAPGPSTPLLDKFTGELLDHFQAQGHSVLAAPGGDMDVLMTTAAFGKPVNWRDALMFTARQRFKLQHAPTVFTIVHATPEQFQEKLDYFEKVLAKDAPDPADYEFPGLTSLACHTLFEQGRRGGPILSLVRLVQSQALSIRIILVVGDETPQEAYTFDLVGAHPRSDASDGDAFYHDLMLRIVTAASTREVAHHELVGEPVPLSVWRSLSAPAAMLKAGRELGARNFFTEMVRIANLVSVPALHDAVSSQYSEGCFATWDPALGALITTVTGSARPVDKGKLSEDELAIIVGVRPDGLGAQIRHVEGKRNDPPSSEAVELMEMDSRLPAIRLEKDEWGLSAEVPVARSKLHGHRGVRSFDPRWAEHVALDIPYYYYPVSCSTEAQANAILDAFGRSAALNDPADPRQVVFTVLPGHGVVIVEKWVPGKAPFQVIWEYMDAGILEIENLIPQGPLGFYLDSQGKMMLERSFL